MKHSTPLLFAFTLLGGCANPSHLIFHQSTSVGVDVAGNTDSGHIHVALGYDRQTNALIPKTKLASGKHEAMSAISTGKVEIKWLGVHEVTEQFATGQAAVNLARSPQAAAQVLTLTQPTSKVDTQAAP